MPSIEHFSHPQKRLGRGPVRSDTRALLFNKFVSPMALPERSQFWPTKTGFPLRIFGNNQYGDCTLASQAQLAMRAERLEVGRRASITDDEVIRVYVALSDRLYGGGDNGAYETDALSNWRNKDYTFRDTQGRPLTIDAFTRINPFDHEEVKTAIWLAPVHGIKICLNLPAAFSSIDPPADWDIPEGQQPIGEWMPGSWGGHSMTARDYDEIGIWLVHTWGIPDQRITWRAAAIYLDEAHSIIDSMDFWRTKLPEQAKLIDLEGIKREVNRVSSIKLAA